MRCPKCGYISFDQIDKCLRCGKDIGSTAAEVNGSAYNVPAPDYLVFDVHEKREQNDADTSEEIFLGEEALEAGEVVDFDFANESSEAPVEVNLDSVEEVEAEDEGEHEIEMDMNFFEEESAVLESPAPASALAPALESEPEEEGIDFDFDTPPAGPISPVASNEDITEKVEEVFEKAENIELGDAGLDHLFDIEEPAPATAHDSSKLSMDDFDMDLDLCDLDLGLDDEKK